MKVGTRIREIRKQKGLTILELATAINSDVGNISRLERNKQGYSDAILSKIASALGVAVADLFSDGEIEQKQEITITNISNKQLTKEEIELLELYNSLPKEEAQKFLREMKAKKAHYDAIFEEMLKKRGLDAS